MAPWSPGSGGCFPVTETASRVVEIRAGHRALYGAFDVFPGPKGAATHIGHMARTLAEHFDGALVCTLGDPAEHSPHERDTVTGIEMVRYMEPAPALLARARAWGDWIATVAATTTTLELVHVRDPWSAATLFGNDRWIRVFEVNGLPSIELPERYAGLPSSLIAELAALERWCFQRSHAIVTPSQTMAANLVRLGAPSDRIVVVPNGADAPPLDRRPPRPAGPGAPARYLIYVGAIQHWQGVHTAIRALALLNEPDDPDLVIIAAARPREAKELQRLSRRLGVEHRLHWRFRIPRPEVAQWLAHAEASLAPLTECARNLDQGACPIKILESMAVGTPVVSSALPIVEELIDDGVHGLLVPPDRPSELARALRLLLDDADRRSALGNAAHARITRSYTWAHTTSAIRELYSRLHVQATQSQEGRRGNL